MIRLLRTEFTRLRWRRAVLILIGVSFVIPALMAFSTIHNTRPITQAERDHAMAMARTNPGFQGDLAQCQKHPRRFGQDSTAGCEPMLLSEYGGIYRDTLDLHSELRQGGTGVAAVVMILMLLAGATFAGADWNSGSMSNQLLFEPRRLRVWLGKAVAIGVVAGGVAVVVQGLWWLTMIGVAHSRSLPISDHVRGEIAWMIARCTFVTVVAALGGFALTMLFRSTVFTVSTLFAISVLGTYLVLALPLGNDKQRWMLPTNIGAVMRGKVTYWTPPPPSCQGMVIRPRDHAMRALCNGQHTVTVWQGLVYIGIPFALVVALSLWGFRRRDVP